MFASLIARYSPVASAMRRRELAMRSIGIRLAATGAALAEREIAIAIRAPVKSKA
jgi:hypothetical protein